MSAPISLDQIGCMHVTGRLPSAVTVRVPLPFDAVLEDLVPAEHAVIRDGLDFVLFLTSDQVGWWLDEVGPMSRSLYVWGQQRGVKDVMDVPGPGEFQPI